MFRDLRICIYTYLAFLPLCIQTASKRDYERISILLESHCTVFLGEERGYISSARSFYVSNFLIDTCMFHEYFIMSAFHCHLYYFFFWHSICHTPTVLKLLSKMSNEIFIQFHILENITVGNLNTKYIEVYKVSVVLWDSPVDYETGLSGPDIWAVNVTSFRCPHSFKYIKSIFRIRPFASTLLLGGKMV